MRKVPIDFPVDFESDQTMSFPIGRLVIGDAVCRLQFGVDGKVLLVCPEEAKSHIKFLPPPPDDGLYGFKTVRT
tara:strand:- start:1341 stop:1562 length:222 start_codon:yes stop_codon:yes gene_type:complete